ncbi:hypothetical protein J2127_001169 [Methanococcus voltae]|uniref:PLAT/LH2 domain-containing protein n=1 Tax=Methanococcus voltae TaxID=2188 RepID=UPI001AE74A94|nr:PLAT/LH2 domain-containing protein [Methanococcus voltae]MBP2144000.1 hypothetical protein [Methanococcus voltae]
MPEDEHKRYIVQIKTQDRKYAGTDSNVFLKLYGDVGVSKKYILNEYLAGNPFKEGSLVQLELNNGKDIGDIYKIKLSTDATVGNSGWLPEYVTVKNKHGNSAENKFYINEWLNGKEIERNSINYKTLQIQITDEQSFLIPGQSKTIDNRDGSQYNHQEIVFTNKFVYNIDYIGNEVSGIVDTEEDRFKNFEWFKHRLETEGKGALENQMGKKLGFEETLYKEADFSHREYQYELYELTPYWETKYHRQLIEMGSCSLKAFVPYSCEYWGYKLTITDKENNQKVEWHKKP